MKENTRVLSFYAHCGQEWESIWDSACDDECPVCGAAISPYDYHELYRATITTKDGQLSHVAEMYGDDEGSVRRSLTARYPDHEVTDVRPFFD